MIKILDGVEVEMTDEEIAAREAEMAAAAQAPPPGRNASGKQLRYALNSLGKRAAWEAAVSASKQEVQDYWVCCAGDLVPEHNLKIAKLCGTVGIAVAALFDVAVTE